MSIDAHTENKRIISANAHPAHWDLNTSVFFTWSGSSSLPHGPAEQRTDSCLYCSSDKSYYKALSSSPCWPKAWTLDLTPKPQAQVATVSYRVCRTMCADTHPVGGYWSANSFTPISHLPPSAVPRALKQTSPSFVLKYSNLCEGPEQLCCSCAILEETPRGLLVFLGGGKALNGCSALPPKHSDRDELKIHRLFYLPGQSDLSNFPLQNDFILFKMYLK